jgi:isopentenyl diphosphate isomerase/L-lactate dehydrogenase-like FMN-dependent dehydrogenase
MNELDWFFHNWTENNMSYEGNINESKLLADLRKWLNANFEPTLFENKLMKQQLKDAENVIKGLQDVLDAEGDYDLRDAEKYWEKYERNT